MLLGRRFSNLSHYDETDPVIEAARWLRDHYLRPRTLPLTCTLAALSLAASVLLIVLIDVPKQYHPHEIDSRPIPPVLLLVWPTVWAPCFAAVFIPRFRAAIAPAIAATTGVSLLAGPVVVGGLNHFALVFELVAALTLLALNGATALATLNLRMLTWVLTICTLVLLAWGSFVASIIFAYTTEGYGALGAFIYWEGTMVVILVLGMLALWTAQRFWESLGYLLASPVVNFLWIVAQFGMARLAPWLVIPLPLLLNGAYAYLAWRLLLRKQPIREEPLSDLEPRRVPLQP